MTCPCLLSVRDLAYVKGAWEAGVSASVIAARVDVKESALRSYCRRWKRGRTA